MTQQFDYDLVIIGAGVGGHGAALHAVDCGLKTAIIEAADMGGTCVNRGCIPSKALLAASGRVRELRDQHHLQSLGIQLGQVNFDRGQIAAHADNLVDTIRGNLTNSLTRLKVEIIHGWGKVIGNQKVVVKSDAGEQTITSRDIIIASGSVPWVPQESKLMAEPSLPVTMPFVCLGSLIGSRLSVAAILASNFPMSTPPWAVK